MKIKNMLFVACSLVLSLSCDVLPGMNAEMSELANPTDKKVCIIGACPGVFSWGRPVAEKKVEELAAVTDKTVFVDLYTRPYTDVRVKTISQDLNAQDAVDNLIRQDVRNMDLAITDYCVYYDLQEDRVIDLLKLLKTDGHLLVGPVGHHCSSSVCCASTLELWKGLRKLSLRRIYTTDVGEFSTTIGQDHIYIGWYVGKKTTLALEQNAVTEELTSEERMRKNMIFEYLNYAAGNMTEHNLEAYIRTGWNIETSVTTMSLETASGIANAYLPPAAYEIGQDSVWIDIKKLS